MLSITHLELCAVEHCHGAAGGQTSFACIGQSGCFDFACWPADHQNNRCTQEVGIHPLVPAETLRSTPLDNAVALLPLAEVASANGAGVELPPCSTRMAVTVDGTESDEQIAALKVRRLTTSSRCS